MDPALQELQEGDADAEIEAVIRLRDAAVVPAQVRIIAWFGRVATCRLRRRDIEQVWHSAAVISLKAARLIAREPQARSPESATQTTTEDDADPGRARFAHPTLTGRGTVVGIADWGFDFTHPNFRHPDGTTRFLAIWDQSAPAGPPTKYGYGRVYSAAEINAALQTTTPFQTLGYHASKADPAGEGAHGTHVLDIAAGNGRVGAAGLAPGAHLLAVHLAADHRSEHTALGDSVRLLEALDYLGYVAGARPLAVNLSMGRHGGPHDGLTLVEQALDAWLDAQPGRAVVQSSGNYYQAQTHASGRVAPGQRRTLSWVIDPADTTPNELEVWYSGRDRLRVEVRGPGWPRPIVVPLGEKEAIVRDGQLLGRIYHRAHDPNNGNHHLDIFTYRPAPAGTWQVTLVGDDVADGRFHAWIERDAGCYGCQSRFAPADVDPRYTTGTICNGLRTLAVGAYDARSPTQAVGSFSSSGPTVNGRLKPDLAAPGVGIVAARSAPPGASYAAAPGLLTRKSGTSMAAPHVTGTLALLFEAAGRPLSIHTTRRLLLATLDPVAAASPAGLRYGRGRLNSGRAVAAALALPATRDAASSSPLSSPVMETYVAEAVQSAGTLTQQGQHLPLYYDAAAVLHQAPDLDTALRQALAGSPGVYLVLGKALDGADFKLFQLNADRVALLLPAPGPVIDYAAPASAVALVAAQPGQGRVFVPDTVWEPTTRWVEVPGLREFYAQPAATQAAHKREWATQLAAANGLLPLAWLQRLGAPVLRTLLAPNGLAEASDESLIQWYEAAEVPAPVAAAPCGCGSHGATPTQEIAWEAEDCAEGCGCGSACGAAEDTFYEDYINPATAFVLGAFTAGFPWATARAQARRPEKDEDGLADATYAELGKPGLFEDDEDEENGALAGSDSLVELAEQSLDANPHSVAALLQRVVFAEAPAPPSLRATPAEVFAAFRPGGPVQLRQQLSSYLAVVAQPRDVLTQALRPGDVILHQAYGEGHTYAAIVVTGDLLALPALRAARYETHGPGPGRYVQVLEAGPFPKRRAQAFARRVTDGQRRLAHDLLILRPQLPVSGPAERLLAPAEDWAERAPRARFNCCNYPPSAVRQAFHAAQAAGNWAEAYRQLNGLNMYEMLCALASLARPELDALWSQRLAADAAGLPRMAYAHTVVRAGLLPATAPGDLDSTGQVDEAAEFLAERLMPEAEKVNTGALPHLALILKECRFYGVTDKSHVAYILASAHHESGVGRSLSEKYNGDPDTYFNAKYQGKLGNTQPGDGSRFRGRGYVQLTGRVNYARYTDILSATRVAVDLVADPLQAAQPAIAAPILVHGMVNGTFTGAGLARYGADGSFDFAGARAIVNGDGRKNGAAIARIARRYRDLLNYKRCA